MNAGVPTKPEPLTSGFPEAHRRHPRTRAKRFRFAILAVAGMLSSMLFATGALAAPATVGLGTAASFSVLGGSTITNTGPTTMFGDLGLAPGSSVTGAPVVLGQTHVADAVAIEAKNSLTTAYNDAAGRSTEGSAGTDLAGQTFTAGVRTASSSLLLSSGSVILDAQGDPNAVFIFQIGSTLITGSNTTVQLINGAQACNVFWQVGSSATLGTGTRFVGTVMAAETITANTAATIHGRLLAQTAAVNLDTNTITQANCAIGATETATPQETAALETTPTGGGSTTGATTTTTTPNGTSATPTSAVAVIVPAAIPPLASKSTVSSRRAAAHRAAVRRARRAAARRRARRAASRRSQAQPVRPTGRGSFTG
jgi:Ice-binding-like